jgi:hypothetical protein
VDILTKRIDELDRATYNPRVTLQPGDPEYESIKQSIAEFGMVEPVVWNQQTNRVVGGHQRRNILENEFHAEDVDVSVVDLDETQEQLLNLALNNAKGRWDEDRLAEMVRTLSARAEFTVTGFSGEDVNRILRAHDARHSTDFLRDILDAPAAEDGEVRTEQVTDPRNGAIHFNLSFAVTREQRQTITLGLTRVREQRALANTVEALVWVCEQYASEAVQEAAAEPPRSARRRRRVASEGN